MELIADEIKLRQDAIAYQVVNKLKNVLKDTYSILYYNFPLYRGDVPNAASSHTSDDLNHFVMPQNHQSIKQ